MDVPEPFSGLSQWYWNRYQTYRHLYSKVPLYDRTLGSTHFDYVDDLSVNAVASKQDVTYLIGVHLGAILNISMFFDVLLSHSDVLVGFGDARHEKKPFDTLANTDWTLPLDQVLQRIGFHPHAQIGPVDPSRRSVAQSLATFALDFLFFHEMGHIANNHIDYCAGRHSRGKQEAVAPRMDKATEDDRALELNADAHAVGVTVLPWIRERFPEGQSFAFPTPRDGLIAWTIAVGFLFLLLDQQLAGLVSYHHRSRSPKPTQQKLANESCARGTRRSAFSGPP